MFFVVWWGLALRGSSHPPHCPVAKNELHYLNRNYPVEPVALCFELVRSVRAGLLDFLSPAVGKKGMAIKDILDVGAIGTVFQLLAYVLLLEGLLDLCLSAIPVRAS